MTVHTLPLLPYAEVRPLIRSGDLLLCQGTSTFARLIQHATGADWSHVGCLVWAQALDRLLVFESVESIGCRAIPFSRYVSNYAGDGQGYPGRIFVGRHSGFLPDELPAYSAFAQRAIDLLGSPYDTQTILRIAARAMLPIHEVRRHGRIERQPYARVGRPAEYHLSAHLTRDGARRRRRRRGAWHFGGVRQAGRH